MRQLIAVGLLAGAGLSIALPAQAVTFDFAIYSGGNPASGTPLLSEQKEVLPGDLDGPGVYTWDVSSASLALGADEVVTFTFKSYQTGLIIAANHGPGYDGGELYRNGVPLLETDPAFISTGSFSATSVDAAFITTVGGVPDQGEIFGTGGLLILGTDVWSQSITNGVAGLLTGIQFQIENEVLLEVAPGVFLPLVDISQPIPKFVFNNAVFGSQLANYDPPVAIGYEFAIGDGNPNFESIILPDIGDGTYELQLFDGSQWVFEASLLAGLQYEFGDDGVDMFRILGIERGAGLDPANGTAFQVALSFVDDGQFTGSMTPIVSQVPVPAALPLLATGLGLMGWFGRGRLTRDRRSS